MMITKKNSYSYHSEALVIRRSLNSLQSKNDMWHQHNIFHTNYTVYAKNLQCYRWRKEHKNCVTKEMIDKLKLEMEPHIPTLFHGSKYEMK